MSGVRERRADPGTGWLLFAAVMLFIAGFFNIIYGIAALEKNVYLENSTTTLFQDLHFWGWLWIAVGAAEMVASFGVAARNQAARWFGIAISAANAVGQLAFLRAYPAWSILIIAVDVLIIYALATYGYPTRSVVTEPYPEEIAAARRREAAGVAARGTTSARDTGQSGMGESSGGTQQRDTGGMRGQGTGGQGTGGGQP